MIPMRGTCAGCCAYAATGHAAAAPPISLMDWRLVTWSMGSPPEPAVPAYRILRLPWKAPAGPWADRSANLRYWSTGWLEQCIGGCCCQGHGGISGARGKWGRWGHSLWKSACFSMRPVSASWGHLAAKSSEKSINGSHRGGYRFSEKHALGLDPRDHAPTIS